MKHTKEPWVLCAHSNPKMMCGRIEDVHGKSIAVIHNRGTAEADSKRIVSCVNAFEGIEDPEIWMKTNREHVEGLLKGGAQNADVAIKAGEKIEEQAKYINELKAAIKVKDEFIETTTSDIMNYQTIIGEKTTLVSELSKTLLEKEIEISNIKNAELSKRLDIEREYQSLYEQNNVLKSSYERTTNLLTDLKTSFWKRLAFLFSAK